MADATVPLPRENDPPAWRDLAARHEGLIALLLLFLITIPMCTKIFTSDFGTHLALGRQIWQDGRIADREFLNYPSLGMEQKNPVWLFQAILWGIFSAGGEYAVSFLLWAIVFGIFFLLYRSCVLRGADPVLAVLSIFAFSGFLRIRVQPRPEMFTYLFIALTIFLFSEFFHGKRNRLVWLFPPLLLVWANSHPTYLMAFLLCGVFTVDRFARAAWNRELSWERVRPWLLPPVLAGTAGLLLCGINPNGYSMLLAPLQTISRGAVGGGDSAVMMSISELTPVKGTGMYWYYQAALGFAAVSLLIGTYGRRLYLLDLLLLTIAFKGAWDSARAVSMMGLFLSPATSLHLTGCFERLARRAPGKEETKAERDPGRGDRKGRRKRKKPKRETPEGRRDSPVPVRSRRWTPRAAAAGLAAAALLLFGGATLSFSMSQLEYGVGITEHKFSFQAAEFLRKNPIPGNMFNFFDIGGFLDWQLYPQARTFLDGRTYNRKVFLEHQTVTGGMPGWREILDRYGVTHIVTKAVDSSGMVLPIISALANAPDWSLVYSDGLFVIFVKHLPETEAYRERHAIPKGNLYRHIILESYHYIYLGVSPALAYLNIANMYAAMGDRETAIRTLRKAYEETGEEVLRRKRMQMEQGRMPPAGRR
ncbi:MAG: hypothetical protein Kow00128_16300 [Deltaproteobacteria bacterium]